MFGQSQHQLLSRAHTADTLQVALNQACQNIEAEIEALEVDTATKLQSIQSIIGDLSDLRYGKFARPAGGADLAQDIRESLQRLQKLCEQSAKG